MVEELEAFENLVDNDSKDYFWYLMQLLNYECQRIEVHIFQREHYFLLFKKYPVALDQIFAIAFY